MPSDKKHATVLWIIACGCEVIAAILETIERNYLKAASFYCLALSFLFFAAGLGSSNRWWHKALLFALVFVSVGLMLYQVAVGKLI